MKAVGDTWTCDPLAVCVTAWELMWLTVCNVARPGASFPKDHGRSPCIIRITIGELGDHKRGLELSPCWRAERDSRGWSVSREMAREWGERKGRGRGVDCGRKMEGGPGFMPIFHRERRKVTGRGT